MNQLRPHLQPISQICPLHQEPIKGICLTKEKCSQRLLCRTCRRTHDKNHLNHYEELEDLIGGNLVNDLLNDFEQLICKIDAQASQSSKTIQILSQQTETLFNKIQQQFCQKLAFSKNIILDDINQKFRFTNSIRQIAVNSIEELLKANKIITNGGFQPLYVLENLIQVVGQVQLSKEKLINDPEMNTQQINELAAIYLDSSVSNNILQQVMTSVDQVLQNITEGLMSKKPKQPNLLFPSFELEKQKFPNQFKIDSMGILQKKNDLMNIEPNLIQPVNTSLTNYSSNQSNILNLNSHSELQTIDTFKDQTKISNSFENFVFKSPGKVLSDDFGFSFPQQNLDTQAQLNGTFQMKNPFNNMTSSISSLYHQNNPIDSIQASDFVNGTNISDPNNIESQFSSQPFQKNQLFLSQKPSLRKVTPIKDQSIFQQISGGIQNVPKEEIFDNFGYQVNNNQIQSNKILEELASNSSQNMFLNHSYNSDHLSTNKSEITQRIFGLHQPSEEAQKNSGERFSHAMQLENEPTQKTTSTPKLNSQHLLEIFEQANKNIHSSEQLNINSILGVQLNQPLMKISQETLYRSNDFKKRQTPQKLKEIKSGFNKENINILEFQGSLQTQHKNILFGGMVYIHTKQQLVTAGREGVIQVWNIHRKKNLYTFNAHKGDIFTLFYIQDKGILVSSGMDSTIKIWDCQNEYKLINSFKKSNYPAYALEFIFDMNLIACGGEDGQVYFWNIETSKEAYPIKTSNSKI